MSQDLLPEWFSEAVRFTKPYTAEESGEAVSFKEKYNEDSVIDTGLDKLNVMP